jgi:UTP--glucose-1-phosphate uridylyltransferase
MMRSLHCIIITLLLVPSVAPCANVSPIKKAVVPAAGLGTRFLPVTKSVPKEMVTMLDKPSMHLIAEEALAAGVNEFLFIVGNRKNTIQDYFTAETEFTKELAEKKKSALIASVQDIITKARFTYITQDKPLGLGHAVLQAKKHIKNEFFGIMLPDDLIFNATPGLKQLTDIARKHNCCVIAVQEVPAEAVSSYGIIEIKNEIEPGLYDVKDLVEKPKPENAPSRLAIVGRYVMNDAIFPSLEAISPSVGGELQLTDAIAHMLRTNPNVKVYAYKIQGVRHDIGNPLGWVKAVIAMALEDQRYSKHIKDYMGQLIAAH